MIMQSNATGIGPLEASILERLDRERRLVWRVSVPMLSLTLTQRSEAAHRLSRDGRIVRIEKGIYLVMPRSGPRMVLPDQLVGAWFQGEPHAIIGAAASHYHRLTADTPRVIEVQLARPKAEVTFQGQRYRFTKATPVSVAHDNVRMHFDSGDTHMASPGKLVVLMLTRMSARRRPQAHRDLRSVTDILLRGGRLGFWKSIDWPVLVKRHGTPSAARRLGLLLETFGFGLHERLRSSIGTSGNVRLDTTRGEAGYPIDRRWKVVINDPEIRQGKINAHTHV